MAKDMIKLDFKRFFVDRQFTKAIDRARKNAVMAVGRVLRIDARDSMKRGSDTTPPSRPGQPPVYRRKTKKTPFGGLLRKLLFFGYDASTESVVVGPVKLGNSNAPALLEFGGTSQTPPPPKRRVGQVGPIRRVGGREVARGRGGKIAAPVARIVTQTQADRVNEILAEMFPARAARMEARPFMGPALRRNASKLGPEFAKAFRKQGGGR